MGTWVPDLPSSGGNSWFGHRLNTVDLAFDHKDLKPSIVALCLFLLSTMHCFIDLTMKANPCLRIKNTIKNKKEFNLILQVRWNSQVLLAGSARLHCFGIRWEKSSVWARDSSRCWKIGTNYQRELRNGSTKAKELC
jgi:hypothetical protein